MSSSVLESLWREGLSMDSSIFSDDDDCVDWRWPASSPRRCDRERGVLDTEYHAAHQNITGWTSGCSCSRSSSNASTSNGSMEENFLYCTEELGSESTCGSVDPCIAAPDKGTSSSCSTPNIPGHSSLHASADSFAPHHHHHHQYCRAAFRRGRSCTFPPPITSLLTDRPLMRSFKSSGRFILKKVANVSRSLFRATRSNGSLRLDLVPSSFDCVESQQDLFFPAREDKLANAESTSTTDEFVHVLHQNLKSISPPYHLLSSLSLSPYSIFLQRKPVLNYAALCQPSKLQAFAMIVNPKGACCPVVEKSDTVSEAGHQLMKDEACGISAALVHQSRPRVFALLKVLPRGLGLIIFGVGGKSNGGGHIIVHGMCILESSGFQCGRAAMPATPSHDHLTPSNSRMGASMEDPKGKLSPLSNEGCRRERYMVKGVFA